MTQHAALLEKEARSVTYIMHHPHCKRHATPAPLLAAAKCQPSMRSTHCASACCTTTATSSGNVDTAVCCPPATAIVQLHCWPCRRWPLPPADSSGSRPSSSSSSAPASLSELELLLSQSLRLLPDSLLHVLLRCLKGARGLHVSLGLQEVLASRCAAVMKQAVQCSAVQCSDAVQADRLHTVQ
jgi:hypothetical protein